MADLLINGQDAFVKYGVRMGDNFLNALGAPAPMKAYIENDSRAKNGKQVLTGSAKIASRQLSLEFTIEGATQSDFTAKKRSFFRCCTEVLLLSASRPTIRMLFLDLSWKFTHIRPIKEPEIL